MPDELLKKPTPRLGDSPDGEPGLKAKHASGPFIPPPEAPEFRFFHREEPMTIREGVDCDSDSPTYDDFAPPTMDTQVEVEPEDDVPVEVPDTGEFTVSSNSNPGSKLNMPRESAGSTDDDDTEELTWSTKPEFYAIPKTATANNSKPPSSDDLSAFRNSILRDSNDEIGKASDDADTAEFQSQPSTVLSSDPALNPDEDDMTTEFSSIKSDLSWSDSRELNSRSVSDQSSLLSIPIQTSAEPPTSHSKKPLGANFPKDVGEYDEEDEEESKLARWIMMILPHYAIFMTFVALYLWWFRNPPPPPRSSAPNIDVKETVEQEYQRSQKDADNVESPINTNAQDAAKSRS